MERASESVIEIRGLTRRFGAKQVLEGIDLTVPKGGVFGLIGGNGAGKTTLIKHLIGMLKAQQGTVRVFGRDPVEDPVGVLGSVGYLSEDRDLPNWMRVGELMSYTSSFYPKWDAHYAEELRNSFDLDRNSRVKTLSRGQRARAGLLVALAHRPELLILDEPSSGLDPVVRRDILGAIIRTIADEGRTVLFSSHLLDEVERVADRIAILHGGKIQLSASMEEIKDSHRRLTVRFPKAQTQPPVVSGMLSCEGEGNQWTMILGQSSGDIAQSLEATGATVIENESLSLDEIFLTRVLR